MRKNPGVSESADAQMEVDVAGKLEESTPTAGGDAVGVGMEEDGCLDERAKAENGTNEGTDCCCCVCCVWNDDDCV